MVRKTDLIRWSALWQGLGAVAFGIVLITMPPGETSGLWFRYLRAILPASTWGAIWIVLGTVSIVGVRRWRATVLVGLAATSTLLITWGVCTMTAAVATGDGALATTLLLWFGGLTWLLTIKAARTPIAHAPTVAEIAAIGRGAPVPEVYARPTAATARHVALHHHRRAS